MSIGEGGIEEKSYTLMAIKTLQETQVFFFSAETCSISPTFWGRTSFIKYSPVAQILADHKNSNEVIKKKLMDWPISSQDPVSCTLKKKDEVIPKKRNKIVFRSKKGLAVNYISRKVVTINDSKRN